MFDINCLDVNCLDFWNCLGHGPKPRKSGTRRVGARRVGPEGWGGPKIRAFFPSPATIFILSSLSWGSFVELGCCFLKAGGCCGCCGWVWLEWDSTPNKMVQRCEESGHLVFISISVFGCGNKEQQLYHLFQRKSTNTDLLFQTIHSVNQLNIDGTVTNLCHQFELTEEEKVRVNLCGQQDADKCTTSKKHNSWCLFRQWHLQAGCEKTCWASKHCPVEFS